MSKGTQHVTIPTENGWFVAIFSSLGHYIRSHIRQRLVEGEVLVVEVDFALSVPPSVRFPVSASFDVQLR